MSDLREVAALPWAEDLLVTAEFEQVVHVWSRERAARCATFETVYDFGGRRVALVPGKRPVVVAGAYTRHGVCGYDLSGERLWQDRSRTNVQVLTALAGGRVAVSCNRGPTRVLDAATGEEVGSLRGVLQVIALTPDLSLAVGSGWFRLLDGSLDPLGPRIPTGLNPVWLAAGDGEHLAVSEIGGPLRLLDLEGRERARVAGAGHFGHVVHDPVTATWVLVQVWDDGQTSLLRLTHDAEVLEHRPCSPFRDVVTMDSGKVLVLLTDEGPQVVDCSNWSTRALEAV
ncbi:hypothetical protein AB2L28_09140 [Kineococcus sp. TBRC 1896]|uniref:Pyrroloquinoline-quinone binding quinoprotein n=1 Tax=Kineococcus mangrovi TaxID=1660183 RepID=A0ABV4I3V2_9ACTN